MDTDTKASPPMFDVEHGEPFKILSERQMEWIQFKAKQRLLVLKEDEEWKNYCKNYSGSNSKESACPTTHEHCAFRQEGEGNGEVSPMDQNTLPTVNVRKSRGIQCEPAMNVQVSPFHKISLGKTIRYPVSGKVKTLDMQQGFQTALRSGICNIEDIYESGPNRQRMVKTVSLPNLEFLEPFIESKSSRNIGFTMPYVLKEKGFLARRAYMSSANLKSSKRSLQSKKEVVMANVAKNIPTRHVNFSIAMQTQTEGGINALPLRNSRPKEKSNLNQKKKVAIEKIRPTSVKERNSGKIQNEAVEKVLELVLNETLDKEILEVEKKEEIRKRNHITSQLNSILHKLHEIESEESVIQHRWKSLFVKKPDEKQASALFHHDNEGILTSLEQEKFVQPIINEMIQNAVQNTGSVVHNITSTKEFLQNETIAMKPTNIGTYKLEVPSDEKTLVLPDLRTVKEIGMSPESLSRIYNYRKNYYHHLKLSLHLNKPYCNIWNISAEAADELLEECIKEIADELSEIPSSLVVDLYNQEFQRSGGP